MQINVLEYLDNIQNPQKTSFQDSQLGYTFEELKSRSEGTGAFLAEKGFYKEPIVVFMSRSPRMIAAFFGTVYSGCYYVPIDAEMPRHRIELIFKSLSPRAVICDEVTKGLVSNYDFCGEVLSYDSICQTAVNKELLRNIRQKAIDTDPIYIVFTSGSTGTPKGVAACHRSVIDYVENLSVTLRFSENTVFGSQTPLYVDACLKELYPTLKFGATTYLIPKELFMFPIKLIDFLNAHGINTICWVASALTLISSLGGLEKAVPEHLHTIAFGSEVFPVKQLKQWRSKLPNARFINLYGPTEATGMSCYYEIDIELEENEPVPIGRPFKNTEIFLLDSDNKLAKEGEAGEICIRGTALTLGYFNDPERTAEVFCQNPLNPHYPESIYKTGDIGRYNSRGELVFVSRKDYQIKHMGQRIELGEIELAAGLANNVGQTCCTYDDARKKIVLYYTGNAEPSELVTYLKDKLPRFMIPNAVNKLATMPLTSNGKIDRALLKNREI